MSKGSGRRRITPSDGIRYDDDTMMTNIEMRGGQATMSSSKEVRLGLRTGAAPTGDRDRRWGGKGRKDDHRNWKSHTRGKQYDHNAQAQERQEHHRPMHEGVAARMRDKSLNALIERQASRLTYRVKYERREHHWQQNYGTYNSSFHFSVAEPAKVSLLNPGFAIFERKVRTIQSYVKWGISFNPLNL